MPNFFIDQFRIPPFLLPIYQAAGTQYGVRWEVLAAINEIETDYGRNLNVSSAGALGWMQFMPATWKQYGVDANRDGVKDPFNPVDAIFAAARYLRAAGADRDLRRAIFAYNHADWYVDSVLMRARVDRRAAVGPRRLAHRADAGRTSRFAAARPTRGRPAARDPPWHRRLRPRGRAGDRRHRRRMTSSARSVGRYVSSGRLREHVHLRAPRAVARTYPAQGRQAVDSRDPAASGVLAA